MKSGMALGLFVMAMGAVVFGQFAAMRVYPGALSGLFVIGAGLALLQTAVEPLYQHPWPHRQRGAAGRLHGHLQQDRRRPGTWVIGTLVLRGIGSIQEQVKAAPTPEARDALLDAFADKVHVPYMVMAGVLVLLAHLGGALLPARRAVQHRQRGPQARCR